VWAIDFQFDPTMASKQFKILSIVDEHTREALGGQVEYSITAEDLIDQLDVLVIERGMPRALRMDKDQNSSRKPFANGLSRWTWCLSHQGNLGGMGSSNPSTAGSGTNVPVSTSFTPSTTPRASSGSGRRITTRPGRIHRWDLWPQRFMLKSAPTKNQ
jgi:hypothetical protein